MWFLVVGSVLVAFFPAVAFYFYSAGVCSSYWTILYLFIHLLWFLHLLTCGLVTPVVFFTCQLIHNQFLFFSNFISVTCCSHVRGIPHQSPISLSFPGFLSFLHVGTGFALDFHWSTSLISPGFRKNSTLRRGRRRRRLASLPSGQSNQNQEGTRR